MPVLHRGALASQKENAVVRNRVVTSLSQLPSVSQPMPACAHVLTTLLETRSGLRLCLAAGLAAAGEFQGNCGLITVALGILLANLIHERISH